MVIISRKNTKLNQPAAKRNPVYAYISEATLLLQLSCSLSTRMHRVAQRSTVAAAVFVVLALCARPCAGLVGVSSVVANCALPLVHKEARDTSKQILREASSWIDLYTRAELVSQGPPLATTASFSRPLALAMVGADSSSFVSPDVSAPPTCCPNAPIKKSKILRRRPDDENDGSYNYKLPLARKLAF